MLQMNRNCLLSPAGSQLAIDRSSQIQTNSIQIERVQRSGSGVGGWMQCAGCRTIYKLSWAQINAAINNSQMQEGPSRTGVLKVFRTKTSNLSPDKHNLPLIFMVRLKRGATPRYICYKAMREEFKDHLLDFFEQRIVLRDDETRPTHLQHNQQYQLYEPDNYHSPQKIPSIKELKSVRNHKSRKTSPKKDIPSKQISFSADSKPVRSQRAKNELMKETIRHLRGYHRDKESNQISQNLQESEKQIIQQPNPQPEGELKKILDYDHLIEESACLNLSSPAVIPPIKPKHDYVMQMQMQPTANYHLPQRISFKEPEHQHYSSEEFKESDSSQFLLDQRGKQKRRKEKLLREQSKMQKKKLKKIKKKVKAKSKAKL